MKKAQTCIICFRLQSADWQHGPESATLSSPDYGHLLHRTKPHSSGLLFNLARHHSEFFVPPMLIARADEGSSDGLLLRCTSPQLANFVAKVFAGFGDG